MIWQQLSNAFQTSVNAVTRTLICEAGALVAVGTHRAAMRLTVRTAYQSSIAYERISVRWARICQLLAQRWASPRLRVNVWN